MHPAPWIKAWMDTRWRFIIGAIVFACSTVGVVMAWPTVQSLIPATSGLKVAGIEGNAIQESLRLSAEYPGYIWNGLFNGNLTNLGVIFAILLGAGSLNGPGGRFLLALPALRSHWILSRVGTGLVELLVMCLIPSLVLPAVSPAVGKSFGFGTAFLHGVSLFIGLSVFLCLAALLSAIFEDFWKPLVLSFAVAVGLGLLGLAFPSGLYSVISAEDFFENGRLPWIGWIAAALSSAALTFAAVQWLERQDF